MRFRVALLVVVSLVGAAQAGTLVGKIDLPAVSRPEPATHGFLDRVENPLAPVKPYSVAPLLFVELVGEEKPAAPPQVNWILAGESFDRPVIAAPAGAEVVIKDDSKTPRTLVAKEDAKLISPGPINPGTTKSFRANDVGKVYTIVDSDAPHLVGTLVVVNTPFVGYVDENGHFEINDVPAGPYKLRVWYRGKPIERPDDDVAVAAKGKSTFNPKIPAGAFAAAPAKK